MTIKKFSLDSAHLQTFLLGAGLLLAIRILSLVFSDGELGQDESQYWFWSHSFEFGYFSKPPLIAWVIGITTGIFGDAEWAVRLSSPFFHVGAATFLYFSARSLFNSTVAFWTAMSWLTLPGVILSSHLATTDAALLFFWSGALFFLLRIARSTETIITDFALLGVMIGFGMMAKYAMIYFPLSLAVAILFDSTFRNRILQPAGLLTLIIAVALIAPNIWWNSQNDFQTVAHTADNANWTAPFSRPMKFISYIGDQFAVAGLAPLGAVLFMAARWRTVTTRLAPGQKQYLLLLCFALTPFVIVALQALISRAFANWAATAYPAVVLLTTGFLFHVGWAWIVKVSVAFHFLLTILFSIAMANFEIIDRIQLSTAVKNIRGWSSQASEIVVRAEGFDAVVVDDRPLMGAMLYYVGEDKHEIVTIDSNAHVETHYEAFKAFDPKRHERVLFVTTRNDDAHVNYRFSSIKPMGAHTVELGGGVTRTYHLFDISGYYGKGAVREGATEKSGARK